MEPTARNAAAAAQQRSYEDFEPTTEWKREPNADTLLVYLPGFRKDQLKVQVTSSRQLRITGERPSGNNNKWSRFKKEMPIGSNYEANDIGARFDKGVLYVKHPKLVPSSQPAATIAGNQFPPLQKPQPLPPRPAAHVTTPRPPPQQDMRRPAPAAAAPPPTQPPAWRPVQDQKPSSADSSGIGNNSKPTAAAAAPTTGQPTTPTLPEPSMWKLPPPEPIALPPADKNQYTTNGQRLATPETNGRAASAAGAVAANHGEKKAAEYGNGGRGEGSSTDIRRRASSMVMNSSGKLKEAAMSGGSGVMDMTRKDPKKLVSLVLAVMAAAVIVLFMIKNVAVKSICKFKGDYHQDDFML